MSKATVSHPVTDGHLFTGEYTPEEIQAAMDRMFSRAPDQVRIRNTNNGQRIKTATDYLRTHYVSTI